MCYLQCLFFHLQYWYYECLSMNTWLTWMVGDFVHSEHVGTGREEHRWNRITRKPLVRSFEAPATRLVPRIHWIVVKVLRSTSVITDKRKYFKNKINANREFVIVCDRVDFFEWLPTYFGFMFIAVEIKFKCSNNLNGWVLMQSRFF